CERVARLQIFENSINCGLLGLLNSATSGGPCLRPKHGNGFWRTESDVPATLTVRGIGVLDEREATVRGQPSKERAELDLVDTSRKSKHRGRGAAPQTAGLAAVEIVVLPGEV